MIAKILIGLVAVIHVWFLILEMFLWTRPYGLKAFRMSPQQAADTAVLAKNQGLYNGFLAGGLVFALMFSDPVISRCIATYFLGCVVVAGLYGAATASRVILFVQAIPGAVALAALWAL